MSYSFTEKKRIRKSFAKRASVLPVPFLLATQLDSYAAFLQESVAPDSAQTEGSASGFQEHFSDREPFQECAPGLRELRAGRTAVRRQGMPAARAYFRRPLRAKVRLTIMDKEASKPTVKEVKEQEVYMGEIPLMTTPARSSSTAPSA